MRDYIFSNEYYQNHDALVYTCGKEACAPGHSYGPAARSGYLIHYVIRGRGLYRTRERTWRLTAGDAFLIVPNELIYYEADREDPWEYTWIGFQGIRIRDYLSRTTLLENPVFRYDRDDRIRICHDKMYFASQFRSNADGDEQRPVRVSVSAGGEIPADENLPRQAPQRVHPGSA